MNRQSGPNRIEWTDQTWNPVAGCQHGCRWNMPDGSTAICYAEAVANGVAQAAYPQGFEHHYWHPGRLDEPLKLKTPSRIFLDSMSDLMGHWVPDGQVQAVLDTCAKAPWHTFQLLTKNAPRLVKFEFPPNVWVGVSAPPSVMFGKPLSYDQQVRMVVRQLEVFHELAWRVPVCWMSIEPLSWDIADVLWAHTETATPEWLVIGAASNGRRVYQPDPQWVKNLLDYAGEKTPVFFKGNLRGCPGTDPWREEFPAVLP
jgi:protein gp37